MSYDPTTDFPALMRQTSGGVRLAKVPGLDFVIEALARMGLVTVYVGATAPTVNQTSTVWVEPATPSWSAEATVLLWNPVTSEYEPATPSLWAIILAAGSNAYVFQNAANASNTVLAGTTVVAIERAAPAATTLLLPSVTSQFASGRDLNIVDWSTAVTNHAITLTPNGADTIMRRNSWQLISTADQLSGLRLKAIPDLNGWIIAP